MHPTITQQPGETDSEVMHRAAEHAAACGKLLVYVVPLPDEKQEKKPDLAAAIRQARELEHFAKGRRALADKTTHDAAKLPAKRRAKYEDRAMRYYEEAELAAFEAAEIRRIVLRPR